MIASLRRRHGRGWVVLALLLGVALAVAWRARPAAAVMDRLPPELVETESRP